MAEVRTNLDRILHVLVKKRVFKALPHWNDIIEHYEELLKFGFVSKGKDGDWITYKCLHKAEVLYKKIKYRK